MRTLRGKSVRLRAHATRQDADAMGTRLTAFECVGSRGVVGVLGIRVQEWRIG